MLMLKYDTLLQVKIIDYLGILNATVVSEGKPMLCYVHAVGNAHTNDYGFFNLMILKQI